MVGACTHLHQAHSHLRIFYSRIFIPHAIDCACTAVSVMTRSVRRLLQAPLDAAGLDAQEFLSGGALQYGSMARAIQKYRIFCEVSGPAPDMQNHPILQNRILICLCPTRAARPDKIS